MNPSSGPCSRFVPAHPRGAPRSLLPGKARGPVGLLYGSDRPRGSWQRRGDGAGDAATAEGGNGEREA